jgi:pSer/pThr/pTyr-binding forkhead associated (FHA) protein
MIRCKVCGKQEYHGTLFCSECGSQLVFVSDKKVDTLVNPSNFRGLSLDITDTIPKSLLDERDFLLYYQEEERVIDIPQQNEFTIGRLVEGQVIAPDVDLNQYSAYDLGVSRLHATIRIEPLKNKVHVVDLGSANGTKVNGYQIPANSEVPLNHGDVLSLGKFNLKVILPADLK